MHLSKLTKSKFLNIWLLMNELNTHYFKSELEKSLVNFVSNVHVIIVLIYIIIIVFLQYHSGITQVTRFQVITCTIRCFYNDFLLLEWKCVPISGRNSSKTVPIIIMSERTQWCNTLQCCHLPASSLPHSPSFLVMRVCETTTKIKIFYTAIALRYT